MSDQKHAYSNKAPLIAFCDYLGRPCPKNGECDCEAPASEEDHNCATDVCGDDDGE